MTNSKTNVYKLNFFGHNLINVLRLFITFEKNA